VGVNIFSSNNVTLSNSVVGDVQRRDELTM